MGSGGRNKEGIGPEDRNQGQVARSMVSVNQRLMP